MRFTTLTLIFLFLLVSLSTKAQNEYILTFKKEFYPFTGNDQCRILKVIDVRKNKADIGYLKKGAFNRYTTVVTEQPLDSFLQNSYSKMIVPEKLVDEELVVVVYDFELQDRPGGSMGLEIGTFHFSADIFRGNAGKYRFVAYLDGLTEVRAPGNVTNRLIGKTKNRIVAILEHYSTRQPDSTKEQIYALSDLAVKRRNDNQLYPIYKEQHYKKGIYYTASDFLNHKPFDTGIITVTRQVEIGKTETKLFYANKHGNKDKKITDDYFAVYDGSNWWLNTDDGHNVSLQNVDGEFYATMKVVQGFTGSYSNALATIGASHGSFWKDTFYGPDDSSDKIIYEKGLYKTRFIPGAKRFVNVARAQ